MAELSSSGDDDSSNRKAQVVGPETRPAPDRGVTPICTSTRYCPARWLLAHNDPEANIYTLSSHMCLADLNNDGEGLLALIDFKRRCQHIEAPSSRSQINLFTVKQPPAAPYSCRLRVYRGQKLIYNHFLDDVPSCLLATTCKVGGQLNALKETPMIGSPESKMERPLLTLAINDDVYFYHKLKASHKLSLEDNERITDSLNRSEFEAWQMVRQNKVDVETLRELLSGLSNELGSHQLSSHSNNFLALDTNEDRKNYLLYWKLKKLSNGVGEHIMSMDSICCAAARLKFDSTVTRSGDFGQTREQGAYLNTARWNRVLDLQRSGLVIGTEDRHLLTFELLPTRAILESHYRLPAVPDHLLVERRSPSSIDSKTNLKTLSYKIIVSCRDCCIYCIDQPYQTNRNPTGQPRELLALKCNVLDMCFTGDEAPVIEGISAPYFIVACLDRHVYCFSSANGQCRWVVELEMPATCLISLPIPRSGAANESNLIGVASLANRIDFYMSLSGLIVDSIYLGTDNCQAMTFGRFGREDNCLCLVTTSGHLLIFILKRTARFADAQCLSSAAAHAADALAACSHLSRLAKSAAQQSDGSSSDTGASNKRLKLNKPAGLPTAFDIIKASSMNATDRGLDQLQSDHNCDQVLAKSTIDAHLVEPQLQVPIKSKDFVDHIVEQSRNSTAISRAFAKQMVKLRDKIRSTIEQEDDLAVAPLDGNRVTLTRVTGLGNTYRASLSLRLNLERHVRLPQTEASQSHLLREADKERPDEALARRRSQFGGRHSSGGGPPLIDRPTPVGETRAMSVLVFVANNRQRQCQLKPFRFHWPVSVKPEEPESWTVEKTIEMKLLLTGANSSNNNNLNANSSREDSEPILLNLYVLLSPQMEPRRAKWPQTGASVQPVFISSVNIPTC